MLEKTILIIAINLYRQVYSDSPDFFSTLACTRSVMGPRGRETNCVRICTTSFSSCIVSS